MLSIYTFLSSVLAIILLPFLPLVATRKKYRRWILNRLGRGLAARLVRLHSPAAPTFWIHALSVGEVTSALPLVHGLRTTYPEARIVFSTTTSSGGEVAHKLLAALVDAIIPGPLDLAPVVTLFLRFIRPDVFILVETDFWPTWLHYLARRRVPTLLVNGRISERSFARYRRYAFLFRPVFRTFTLLSMQTTADAAKMTALGIEPEKIATLGNLKYDTSQTAGAPYRHETTTAQKARYGFNPTAPLWICGSTHRGEEEQIFVAYRHIRVTVPDLQLLIAPRNIDRAEEIAALGRGHNLQCRRWSSDQTRPGPLLILDTIGELAGCYAIADVVFVGGSLVAAGGHNPLEPAIAGAPVLFGPHMEDFAEIAGDLLRSGGAHSVESGKGLQIIVRQILADPTQGQSMAAAALASVQMRRGVVRRHLDVISTLLPAKTSAV